MAASNNQRRRLDVRAKARPRGCAFGACACLRQSLLTTVALVAAGCANVAVMAPEAATKPPSPPLSRERGCTQIAPESCFNARDDNCNGIVDEGCGVQGGLIQFTIAWDDAEADVDLNVQDPKGQLAEVGRVTACGLTKERDCPGKDDECKGQNVESVFLESDDDLTRGVYTVKIRLERAGSFEEPVRVNFAARLGPKTFADEFEFAKEQEEALLELKL